MSDKGSAFSTGGGGVNFEQYIQASFLTTLIIQGNAPCLPTNKIQEIALQTANRGYQTDDLLVIAKSSIGEHRLLIQIKHTLAFTENNEIFKEVIKDFWSDYINNQIFNKSTDKLVVIKNGLTKQERNNLKSVLNWAKTHATSTYFFKAVNRIDNKKAVIDVFNTVLKEANNGNSLAEHELYEFLGCFDVLEYDFLNEGSIDTTYLLNLIKISKNTLETANEKEIWDSILAYISTLNKNGGSETLETIRKKEIYKYFDISKLNPYFGAVKKLQTDSESILKPLQNDIRGYHIERLKYVEDAITSISNNKLTIITGEPGVGKSALVKDILKSRFSNASVFVFRADQLNQPSLSNVLSQQGVNEPLFEIFSCLSLLNEKIIVIDSFEKLLEGDVENAFSQLLALSTDLPDLKIIATSRKYAVELLVLKFGIEKNHLSIIEIDHLNDSEINELISTFPRLSSLFKNQNIKNLIRVPAYLKFSLNALNDNQEDLSKLSLSEFKDALWNFIVKKSTDKTRGLPAKREEAFIDIALRRAKAMKLFVVSGNNDSEAIDRLESDHILFQEKDNRKYSPTHDVFEDWALVKYVSQKFEEYPTPKKLFKNIGNEPAIRRAFRLWVEDRLIGFDATFIKFITATINETGIEQYWADELLVAVFKSDDCSFFFNSLKEKLLENQASFLNRGIHLIRTACKENSFSQVNSNILMPIGSGWREILLFISNNIDVVNMLSFSILNLLDDWVFRLLFNKITIENDEQGSVKKIVLFYIKKIEQNEEGWDEEFFKQKEETIITILFNLSDIAKEEITAIVRNALSREEDYGFFSNSFGSKVIKKCLSGINAYNGGVIRELPELVFEVANFSWKLNIKKLNREEEEEEPLSRLIGINDDRLSGDRCWGISDRLEFMPAGIYKTPVLNLLFAHPTITVKFTCDFINYSVEFYANSDCEYKHDITQLDIKYGDGSKRKIWAMYELWVAYRGGMSVTHYLLESLLMSLEKYLLELAKIGTENSRKILAVYTEYLLENSNNVAVPGVLSSIFMAYPTEFGEEILPILSVKEFYYWDLNRALRESSLTVWNDDKISFAVDETRKSNALPHRHIYTRGLGDSIIDYQFKVRTLNEKIYAMFDTFNEDVIENDINWKKKLTEIDIRRWKVGEYNEAHGGFVIQPNYSDDINQFMETFNDSWVSTETSLNFSGSLSKALNGTGKFSFDDWKKCWEYYLKDESRDYLYDRPVSLAILGVKNFENELTQEQLLWCVNTISTAISAIIVDTINHSYDISTQYHLLEKELALESFHLIIEKLNSQEKDEILCLMVLMLSAPFNDVEFDKIIIYIREIFFPKYPIEAKKVWVGFIKFGEFKIKNQSNRRWGDPEERNDYLIKEKSFFKTLFQNNSIINIEEIDFSKYKAYMIARAFVITPYNSDDSDFLKFVEHIISLLSKDLRLKENYSVNSYENDRLVRRPQMQDCKLYLSDLLLNVKGSGAKKVLDLLLESLGDVNSINYRKNKDLIEFINGIFEFVILKLFDNRNIENKYLYKWQSMNFWLLWKHLFEKIKANKHFVFLPILFFNQYYLLRDREGKLGDDSWDIFIDHKNLFYEFCEEFKTKNISKYLIDLFSTVGAAHFLPEGIPLLTKIIRASEKGAVELLNPTGEKLIRLLFHKHISVVKKDNILLNDYLWILNKMIDLGSSNAYLYREQVITYKNVPNQDFY